MGWNPWRQRPQYVVVKPLDPQEARVISAWRLTPAEWSQLTNGERAQLRFDYFKAPGFVA